MHSIDIPAPAAARFMHFPDISPSSTAILVIDLQNFFVSEVDGVLVANAKDIIPNVNLLTDAFRSGGSTVVFIQHTVSDEPRYALPEWQKAPGFAGGSITASLGRLRQGESSHQLHSSVVRRSGDLSINKHRYSAFLDNSSDLHAVLQARGIDTVVIVGATTNVCCESTARDAAMLNYKVFFVLDANAAMSDAFHNATLLNLGLLFADIRPTADMIDLLSHSRVAPDQRAG